MCVINFWLWGILNDNAYINPCTEDDMKESTQDVVDSVSPALLLHAISKCLLGVVHVCVADTFNHYP